MEEQLNYAAQFTSLNAEGDVSDGSVDYYDFNWGNSILAGNQPLIQIDSDELNGAQTNETCGCVKCRQQKAEKESCPNQEESIQIETAQNDYAIIDI